MSGKSLNLEELFGQRERPYVTLQTGGKRYDLALPDEMDPRKQLKMFKLSREAEELIQALPETEDENAAVYERILEAISGSLLSQIALLNRELAEQELNYAQMNAILTFYHQETSPKELEEPEGKEA